MIPSVIGLLVLALGLMLIYVGVHGAGFLAVWPRSVYGGTPGHTVQ